MKRIALFVLGGVLVSTGALAQAPDTAVETASSPPRPICARLQRSSSGSRTSRTTTLKKGTNRLVCYDRTGFPEQQPFSVECTSVANLDRVAQNLKFEASGDKVKTKALLDAAESDGSRVKPEYGSVWYHMQGPTGSTLART